MLASAKPILDNLRYGGAGPVPYKNKFRNTLLQLRLQIPKKTHQKNLHILRNMAYFNKYKKTSPQL